MNKVYENQQGAHSLNLRPYRVCIDMRDDMCFWGETHILLIANRGISPNGK